MGDGGRGATRVDTDDIEARLLGGIIGAVAQLADRRAGEEAFGEAETGRELEVVAWRPHRGGDQCVVETNGQRFFDRELVGLTGQLSLGVSPRQHALRTASAHASQATTLRAQPNGAALLASDA